MPNTPESISYIKIGEDEFIIDAVTINGQTIPDASSYLPSISGMDNNKMLRVIEGQWTLFSPSDLYDLINGIPCGDSGDSDSESEVPYGHDYPNEYLTFEVLTPGDIVWEANGDVSRTIYYSKNNGEWTELAAGSPSTISVVEGDIVRFKGTNTYYATSNANYSGFGDVDYATATYNVYGNIMSLVYGDNFQNQTILPGTYTFCSLFDKSGVVSAANLVLPAMTLTSHCYRALFANCPNLTVAAPLPATTLAASCYRFMFDNDANLTTPPDLPATTLLQESYYGMFHYCSSLHYIKCMATDISAYNCTKQWVEGLPHSGVFVKDVNMYDFAINDIHGIPIGWTVTEEGTLIVEEPLIECSENTITITAVTPDSVIYYKLNHTGEYQIYLGPIDIFDDTFIEVYATKNGTNSSIVTRTYIYVEPEGSESESGDSESEETIHDYSKDYLTFNVLTPGTILWKANGSGATKTIKYSINNGAWTSITSNTTGVAINVAQGDEVRFRGTNTQYCAGNKANYSGFEAGTAKFNVSGNIMSMLAGDNFANANTLPTTYTFTQFFKLSPVVSAEHLILPANTLTTYCYRAMFSKCSELIVAPELPATNLAQGCYYYMFEECSFEKAPDLLATTMASECYYNMFLNCASLNYIRCLALNHQSGQVTNWVKGVAATGTFVKNPNETWITGVNGIPTGWVVYDSGSEPGAESEEEEIYEGPYPALTSFKYSGNEVTLPYSLDALTGQTSNYTKGVFNFTSNIYLDEEQPTYLWFDHADQSADIYIDDTFVETHWGGYNSFFCDITDYVHTGRNVLRVALNNTTRNTLAPYEADFNFNATLGKVELLSSPVLPPVEYGYDGFRIRATVTDASAIVTVTTSVPTTAEVVLTIDDGTFHYTDTVTDSGDITFTTTIQNPHLWNGKSDPHLYDFTIDIYKDNVLYHTFTRPYGFRYYRYAINDTTVLQSGDPYTGFLLNGQPYLLRGVCMHQDIQDKANALTSADIAHDFEIISELGANFIRTAHYPHPREFYDWCDRLGIVVETEVPWVNKAQSTMPADYYTHLASQVTDMVLQHYNHPSIIFWGLANEITTDDAEFTKGKINEYTTIIKSYDNERLVGYVLAQSSTNALATFNYPSVDWVGHNIYVGWYASPNSNDPTSAINQRLNNGINNNVAVGYSEYGCGGNILCHSVDPLTTTTRGNNPRHDIEYQMWLHEGQIAAIKNFPQLAFTSQWVLFDFAVSKRNEGYVTCLDGETVGADDETNRRLNDKGLVKRDHITKKDTFYLYKAWWNTADTFVHICQKDYLKYDNRVIKCYTNDGDSLDLYVNGHFIATATVTNNIATFPAMNFYGDDVIRVDGEDSTDTFTFPTKNYDNDYFTLEALETTTFSNNAVALEYSLDGETWTSLPANTATPSLSAGDKIMFRQSTITTPGSNGIGKFSSTGKFKASGNIMSLYYGDNFANQVSLSGKNRAFNGLFNSSKIYDAGNLVLPATTLSTYCYLGMFSGCSYLVRAPKLPATTMQNYCYQSMFSGCTNLTDAPVLAATSLATGCYNMMFNVCTSIRTAPALPAQTLYQSCYYGMFNGCTHLMQAPVLGATSIAPSCYQRMFYGCTSLVTAPALPATTMAQNCYESMFYGCNNLVNPPTMQGTTLSNYCYANMFSGCSKLTTAPTLLATQLVTGCYEYMFYNCTRLNNITCNATTNISEENCDNWVYGVSPTGTFTGNANAKWRRGVSAVPVGWSTNVEIFVEPVSSETIAMYVDDFPDSSVWEDMGYNTFSDYMDDYLEDLETFGANYYEYCDEFEYENDTYYIWTRTDGQDDYVKFLITDTNDLATIQSRSIEANYQNVSNTSTVIASMNKDLNETYDNMDEHFIVVKAVNINPYTPTGEIGIWTDDFLASDVYNFISDPIVNDCNAFEYTGNTIQYDGDTYYLWQNMGSLIPSNYSSSKFYALTSDINYNTLNSKSLAYDSANVLEHPIEAYLNSDQSTEYVSGETYNIVSVGYTTGLGLWVDEDFDYGAMDAGYQSLDDYLDAYLADIPGSGSTFYYYIDTIEYNGDVCYLWYSYMSHSYLITETNTVATLVSYSIDDDYSNVDTHPFVAMLNPDKSAYDNDPSGDYSIVQVVSGQPKMMIYTDDRFIIEDVDFEDFIDDPETNGANYYEYCDEFEYDGDTYYIWMRPDGAFDNGKYILTESNTYQTLYEQSLEYDLSNLSTHPIVAWIGRDLNVQYEQSERTDNIIKVVIP